VFRNLINKLTIFGTRNIIDLAIGGKW